MSEANLEIRSLNEFKNGWVVGNFEPSLFKTKECEVMVRVFESGYTGDGHFHKEVTEYNILIDGRVYLNKGEVELWNEAIWILKPGEKCDVYYKERSTVVTIKVPSIPGDKHYWLPTVEDAIQLFKAANPK